MSPGEWIALGGVLLTIVLAASGALWKVNDSFSAKVAKLHEKVDDVKDKYVRRDDLTDHIDRFEEAQNGLAKKVDELIMTLIGKKVRGGD